MNLFEVLITQPIFNLLLAIYGVVGDFGVAIIIFTIIVKILLWPITKSQLEQTKLMRKIQPELRKIKKNAKGNKQIETMQTFELYRKNNIKMFRSVLTMFIQIPIFLTLMTVMNITVNKRDEISKFTYEPVAKMAKIQELTSKDSEFKPMLFGKIHLSEKAMPVTSRSSLFLLVITAFSAYAQWYIIRKSQMKSEDGRKLKDIMKEAAEGIEADQSEINQIVSRQMSFMMPLMMLTFMVNLYGALNFYYFMTNVIQFIQQKYVFDIEKDDEKISKISNKTKNAKEAKIVETSNSSGRVRRIKAKDNRRKR